jgi:hypothetical protein
MKYRIRPIDGALIIMVVVIVFACIEPLRGNRWSSVLVAIASLLMLTLLLWQVWRWATRKSSDLSESSRSRKPLRLIMGIVILFPLGLLLMTEVLDRVARHSILFDRAITAASNAPVLCQDVGCPIDIGWPIKVTISEDSDSGAASLKIPISGAKGHANLFAEGTKQGGVWSLNKEYFQVDGDGASFPIITPAGQ